MSGRSPSVKARARGITYRAAARRLDVGAWRVSARGKEECAMSHTQTKPITNWCPQAKPNEEGQCGTDKLAEDGRRHHCDKTPGHSDDLHACKCGMQWKHMM